MTTVNNLENQISCAVCFEICRDPHALKCLHTFCLQCIQQLKHQQKSGYVQCPECRDFSLPEHIKKDFKTQAFIEFYNTQIESSTVHGNEYDKASATLTKGSPNCEICQSKDKPVKAKCLDCDAHLCLECELAHKRLKSSKKHLITPIHVENEVILSCLKQTISELEKESEEITEKSEKIAETLKDVSELNKKQVTEVNNFIDEMINDMECHRESLHQMIKEGNDKYSICLTTSKEMFDKSQADIQTKIDFLNEMVASDEISVLSETLYCVDANIRDEIKEIKSKLPSFHPDMTSPVSVMKGCKWDLTKAIEVKIEKFDEKDFGVRPVEMLRPKMYPQLKSMLYNLENSIHLDFYPRALRIIKNQLWCVADNKIHIYNKDCLHMKEISLKSHKIQYARSLLQSHTGNIFIACSDGQGLIQIDPNGVYLGKVIDGSFSDVSVYNKKLFALEYKTGKIIVMASNKGKWSTVQEIKLKFSNTQSFDRLCVHGHGIYISSCLNNCLYTYSPEGKFKSQTSQNSSLKIPLMCGVDSEGNALIADCDNHKLQVYDKDKQWHALTLPGQLKYPTDAEVEVNGHFIWVITSPPNQLLKFTKV